MRYADVLLMKAEAMIALNGEGDATAKELLGKIRQRAGLAATNDASWKELKLQRRLELASSSCLAVILTLSAGVMRRRLMRSRHRR